MSSRRPSFQFYPQDWTSDSKLQSCSLESQGFWIKLLCKMHDSEVYGKFCFSKIVANDIANGIANLQVSSDVCSKVARVVGINIDEAVRCLNELITAKVIKIDQDGYMFSSRMMRDDKIRKIRQNAGSHGGKSLWKDKKGDGTIDLFAKAKVIANLEQTVEEEEEEEEEGNTNNISTNLVLGEKNENFEEVRNTFEKFWITYDKNIRRLNCEKLWINLTAEERYEILDYVPKYVLSTPEKQYRLNPDKFLEDKAWYNEIITQNSNGRKHGKSSKPTKADVDAALRKKIGG